jgi:diketogulonate reductase-like aldo/keto reductase
MVFTVVHRSSYRKRIEENFAVNFELSAEQMAAISALNRSFHFVSPPWHKFTDE